MVFGFFKRRRRREILARPFPQAWEQVLRQNLAVYPNMSSDQQRHLRELVAVFVAEKTFYGNEGLEITDEIRVTVAGGACLLLLGIEHDYYRNVREIMMYPSSQVIDRFDGLLHSELPILGQAHEDGPVTLAWDAARCGVIDPGDGRNLIYHEFAHKLDMLDGIADGTPPVQCSVLFHQWVSVMTEHFEQLKGDAEKGRRTLLDPYGATNSAEFFAVATECFFEKPRQLRGHHPALFDIMKQFYRQDPSQWVV